LYFIVFFVNVFGQIISLSISMVHICIAVWNWEDSE